MAAREGGRRLRWWGGRAHIAFTVTVFIILASLDNAAIRLVPPLYARIGRDLAIPEASLGLITAVTMLLSAITSVGWGYLGDRSSRKRLLFYGTLIWAAGVGASGFSGSFGQLFAFQVVTALGLGCIASVGFSVISDFVGPRHRGFFLSLWGLTQGIGTLAGTVVAGLLGAADWRQPFFFLAGLGFLFSFLYLLTYDPERGRSEPELARAFAQGASYEYRMQPGDWRILFRRRSNIWLIFQGLTAQFAYGSLVWLPRLFVAKVEALGYSLETATMVGSLFGAITQVGGATSILAGLLGDHWQRRNLSGRALLSAIGILGAIPFYVTLFFLPLTGLEIPEAGAGAVTAAVLKSFFTNGWAALSFFVALMALTLTSVDAPNWYALIGDVNLPEHRGTVYALGNLANGVGSSIGNGLTGVAFASLTAWLAPPVSQALGLALFQLFFIPTGLMYLQAARTTPGDITEVRAILAARGKAAVERGSRLP